MMIGGRPAKILLIDSNVYFSKRMADALKREGFEVVYRQSGGLRADHAGIRHARGGHVRHQHARNGCPGNCGHHSRRSQKR